MVVLRNSLAILAACIAGVLQPASALGRERVVRNSESAETLGLEAEMHQSMTGGYEGQVYEGQAMPGGYVPGGPAYGGAGYGVGGCGHGCGCDNGYCHARGGWDCCCCPPDHWYLEGGVYYLKPHWKTNPAFVTLTDVGGVETQRQTDFDYDGDVAPFVRVGYRTAYGLGIEGRGWWYDDSESIAVVNPGNGTEIFSAAPLGLGEDSDDAGEALTFDSSLRIDVVDLLLTYQMQFEYGSLEFGAGARYARIEQAYHYSSFLVGDDTDSINSSHSFEGAGPSFSVEGRLFATRRLSFFGTARYSLLFGSAHQSAAISENGLLDEQAFQENDDLRGIAELDLGAEYAIRIGCSELFVSAAFVSQLWEGAGNSANNELLVEDEADEVADKNADLGLWGFRAELGARF